MKKIISGVLAVLLVFSVAGIAFAGEDTSRVYSFELTTDGAFSKTVQTGTVITVAFTLRRTDAAGDHSIYAMQNEIKYNPSFFELVPGSEVTAADIVTRDIALIDGNREFYMNFVSFDRNNDTLWSSDFLVGTVQFKVIATTGNSVISNENYSVFTKTGMDKYTATARNLTITVQSQTGSGGTGGGGGGGTTPTPTPNPNPNPIVGDILDTANHFAYMQGNDKGDFSPDKPMTRAEAAQMFYNLLKDKSMGTNASGFSDVLSGAWYETAVRTVASRGFVTGYTDGTFKPNANITRAEFATLAARFDNLSSGGMSFSDVTQSHWAYSYIDSAAAKGWINGYTDGTFRPERTITRAEVVKIVNSVLSRVPDRSYIDSGNVRSFPDVQKDHWAYYEIMECTNAHGYNVSNGNEIWTGLV